MCMTRPRRWLPSTLAAVLVTGLALVPSVAIAEPPANDLRESPATLPAPVGSIEGTLEDSTLEGARTSCPGRRRA